MSRKPWFVLSPCGTSLLTNAAGGKELRDLVNNYSNITSPEKATPEDRITLSELIDRVRRTLSEADETTAAQMSAELNSLIQLYRGSKTDFTRKDFHQLVATDTWLGFETASMVKDWLKRRGCVVGILKPRDLRTDDLEAFQLALSEIVKTLAELLPGYHPSHDVIFNLTGGFKSIQGFLQSLAPFYADETVYIFESNKALLRIPRLPVKLDPQGVVKDHASVFRKLSLSLALSSGEVAVIPETLINRLEEHYDLSPWGLLIWEESKKELYGQQLLPSPSPRLRFSERFKKSIADLGSDRIIQINERVDALVRYLNGRYNVNSLDLKKLSGNPFPPSTHECDAWSDGDARRIFCHFDLDAHDVLILDCVGRHL